MISQIRKTVYDSEPVFGFHVFQLTES